MSKISKTIIHFRSSRYTSNSAQVCHTRIPCVCMHSGFLSPSKRQTWAEVEVWTWTYKMNFGFWDFLHLLPVLHIPYATYKCQNLAVCGITPKKKKKVYCLWVNLCATVVCLFCYSAYTYVLKWSVYCLLRVHFCVRVICQFVDLWTLLCYGHLSAIY